MMLKKLFKFIKHTEIEKKSFSPIPDVIIIEFRL